MPYLSCVSTLYRSELFVEEFVSRMAISAAKITDDFELILVDDGSPDRSKEIAVSLLCRYPQLRVLELSRNFGHHPAILAGLTEARGDFIFLIDSDLEEEPELLQTFWNNIDAVDVIFGVHDRRGKSLFQKLAGNAFWALISAASDVSIVRNLANVRLMRRSYVNALLSMPDRNVFLGGMFAWPGFRQQAVKIERRERDETSYSFTGRFRLAAVAAISFSSRPLFVVFGLGLCITLLSGLTAGYFIILKLLDPMSVVSGFASLMVSIWFLGGLIMGAIGTVGFYIAHIYEQTRSRPIYIVKERHEIGK